MKRVVKLCAVSVLLASLVSVAAFANPDKKTDDKKGQEINRNESMKPDEKKFPGCGPRMDFNGNSVIAKVKSVDEKNGKIKVTDADGNDVEYSITGFTKITVMNKLPETNVTDEKKSAEAKTQDEKQDMKQDKKTTSNRPQHDMHGGKWNGDKNFPMSKNVKENTLSDVKEGSWVMLSLIEGTTKMKQVGWMLVKSAE